ncbi:MAG: hypothetical protein IJ604_02125 [Prevotella sp.]|nr:hypothetical protein [Prevotella sp.]
MTDIDQMSKRYIRQGILLTAGLFLLGLLVVSIWYKYELVVPLIVSALFILAIELADALIWRRVAKKSPGNLASFYTGASGFRLLLSLLLLFIYYLIVGRDNMLPFFLVFICFYVASLIHHSVFFSKVSNRL